MSLQKKILDQIAKDQKKMGGNLAYWMDSRKFLEELGVVADKIRERIIELSKACERLEKSTGCSSLDLQAKISFEREERQLRWVLGLLVGGDETK